MKIVATIEARMTSTRLPGKVLMKVFDRPILHYLIERLKKVQSLDNIVLATTTNSADDYLVEFAEKEGIKFFRGSEDDVMLRVLNAADSVEADVIVEITGDCPLIDPAIIEEAIQTFIKSDADYVGNVHVRSYPDGMDVQVFTFDTLKKSLNMTSDKLDHEHVTLHIRNHPKLFKHFHIVAPANLHWPELGLTLDEASDFELLKKIIEHFGEDKIFSCDEVIKFLKQRNDLISINNDVIRKADS